MNVFHSTETGGVFVFEITQQRKPLHRRERAVKVLRVPGHTQKEKET